MRDIKPVIGYVHTGIEKNCEDKSYWKVIPLIERMDYLSYYFNAMAYCGAVETLLDLEVPPRAQYLRVIHLELNRIASHLLWLATGGAGPRRDVGLLVRLARPRPRSSTCSRCPPASACTRATSRSAAWPRTSRPASRPRCARSLQAVPGAHRPVRGADRPQPDRARAPARRRRGRRRDAARASASPARCCAPPATRGTCARRAPYCALRPLRLQDPGRHDRRQLRPLPRPHGRDARVGARSSSRRSTACPRAPYITDDRKYALPPRHELATSMEALIHHFKLVTEGFRVPPGEAYYPIESPRGELGCFVRSDGSSKPARVHMRDPSFVNLQAFNADGAGRLHRRPDRDAGHARPDPRRASTADGDRPVAGQALRPRLARPRLGRRRRPRRRTRRSSPTPRRRRCPAHVRTAIEELMAKYPDIRSAAIPAMKVVQREHGWLLADGDRAGRVRDAPHARLPRSRWRASTTCSSCAPRARTDVYVCTNISCSLLRRRRDLRRRCRSVPASDPRLQRARRSSASAPARSRRWPRSTASTSAR